MATILVTGAGRGIGLEFARQFRADGWRVIATCRDPDGNETRAGAEQAAGLRAMGAEIHPLDVRDGASVAALGAALRGEAIDVLVNNAGVIGQRTGFGTFDYAAWADAFDVNVLGPMRVAETLADAVLASGQKRMIFLSSLMGSIAEAGPNACVYRSSKAALNMAVRCMALELGGRGLTAILFHPGHVQTDMGGAQAPITPHVSVAGMKAQILSLTPADNGRFLSFEGKELPW